MQREELESQIKSTIIATLDLEDITAEDIVTDAPLFKEGLGLDSIDALELGVALKRKFNFSVNAEDPELKKHFFSVKTLADYIEKSSSK